MLSPHLDFPEKRKDKSKTRKMNNEIKRRPDKLIKSKMKRKGLGEFQKYTNQKPKPKKTREEDQNDKATTRRETLKINQNQDVTEPYHQSSPQKRTTCKNACCTGI